MEKNKTIKKTAFKQDKNILSTPKATISKTEVSATEETTPKKLDTPEENVLSSEELGKALLELQKEIEVLKKVKNTGKKNRKQIAIDDDFLDPPATFFAYSISYSLYGDKRKNRINHPPNNQPIIFEPHYRYNKNTGGTRGAEVVSISRATVRSKSMATWIREHTQFGIRFFESIKSAIDQDTYLAERMVAVSNMISNLGDMQVISRAKQENINISNPDIKLIRQSLIKKIATSEINSEKTKQNNLAAKLGMVETKKVNETASMGDLGRDVY